MMVALAQQVSALIVEAVLLLLSAVTLSHRAPLRHLILLAPGLEPRDNLAPRELGRPPDALHHVVARVGVGRVHLLERRHVRRAETRLDVPLVRGRALGYVLGARRVAKVRSLRVVPAFVVAIDVADASSLAAIKVGSFAQPHRRNLLGLGRVPLGELGHAVRVGLDPREHVVAPELELLGDVRDGHLPAATRERALENLDLRGGELGRDWYLRGRLLDKRNTFDDVNAVATHIGANGTADPTRLTVRGGSAGGLMVGACITMRPDLWHCAVAEVPFVDVVTTMSDPTLPLTVTEWDEWGDPRIEPWASYIGSYSPYDNTVSADRPAMLVTAGLNDPRVGFHEPAKWVARMRHLDASSGEDARALLLRTEMGAGHAGPSGRYSAWREEAETLAFVLTEGR